MYNIYYVLYILEYGKGIYAVIKKYLFCLSFYNKRHKIDIEINIKNLKYTLSVLINCSSQWPILH